MLQKTRSVLTQTAFFNYKCYFVLQRDFTSSNVSTYKALKKALTANYDKITIITECVIYGFN